MRTSSPSIERTGALLWDTEMADWRQNYGATGAPLVVGDLVVSGVSGGDEGVRGFIVALRSGHRERGLAVLDRPPARGAGIRNVEGRMQSIIPAAPHG